MPRAERVTPLVPPRRVGRPARVSRSEIAKAAYEVGFDGLTMRAVAARLGVSAPSLYYHLRDRDDLTRLAAEYGASQLELPRDRGQHWARWLAQWALYTREAFLAQPGLLEQFVNGTLPVDRMVPNIEAAVGFLERQGFGPDDAAGAYMLVSACALGMAVADLRSRTSSGRGKAPGRRSSRPRNPGRFELMAVDGPRDVSSFEDQICTVLVGIAVRGGKDPDEVLAVLSEHPVRGVPEEIFHP